MEHEKEKKGGYLQKMNFYLKASLIGSFRGGIGLIIEHPLESIKTQWQDRVDIKSTNSIVKSIYREKGIIGFYRGFVPNFIRVTSKQVYRWPMMLFFPRFFDKNLPERFKLKVGGLNKIMTGLAIANIEIFFITPLDRLKTFFMTSPNSKHMFMNFYQKNKQNVIRELFRGLEPSFWKQNVSWVSFLYLDFKIKLLFKKFRNCELLKFSDLLMVSIIVGIGNLFLTTPFDFAKTQIQKEGHTNDHTFKVMVNYCKAYGFKILYTGWQFKLIQYIIQSLFTVAALEHLERKSKSLN